jgi:hypothetical protein
MTILLVRLRRYLLAALLVLLAAIGARAQAPEFSYWERTPLPQQGLATYYNPGVMERVLDNRLAANDIDACPDCVGTVALLRAGDIGRKVWLQPPGGDPVGPFLVIDCARRTDVQPLLDRNWVVDVSFEVGQYWGMNRPLDGVIVFEDPADTAPGRQVNRIPTPFAVAPEDVVISAPTATPPAPVVQAIPTAWPTRMPVPLVPQPLAGAAPELPTATRVPPTPTAIWPPPLTPIITTPTPIAPAVSPGGGAERAGASPTPSPTPTEVAIGRAGGELLAHLDATPEPMDLAAPGAALPDATPAATMPAPTARPTLARTPRPNLTPILPLLAMPTATPTLDASPINRLLRELLDLVR